MLPRQLLQEFSIWVHQNTQNYQQILLSINLIIFGTKETRSVDVQDKTSGANVHQQSCRRQDERVITCGKVLTQLTNSVNVGRWQDKADQNVQFVLMKLLTPSTKNIINTLRTLFHSCVALLEKFDEISLISRTSWMACLMRIPRLSW